MLDPAIDEHNDSGSGWVEHARPLRLPIGDPHRADPDQLAIRLLPADVIVAGFAALGDAVLPNKIYVFRLRLDRVYVIVVFYDVDLGEWRGSSQLDLDRLRCFYRELLTHEVAARPHVGPDVI